MSVTKLRQELHNFINHADSKILRMMHSLANEYSKEDDDVVYCGKNSIPMQKLHKQLKEAEAEIARGECISIEEFAKESEKWV